MHVIETATTHSVSSVFNLHSVHFCIGFIRGNMRLKWDWRHSWIPNLSFTSIHLAICTVCKQDFREVTSGENKTREHLWMPMCQVRLGTFTYASSVKWDWQHSPIPSVSANTPIFSCNWEAVANTPAQNEAGGIHKYS